MQANESFVRECRPHPFVDIPEAFPESTKCVVVENAHPSEHYRIVFAEWGVMHVLADDLVAERLILLAEEHMCMPEWIKNVGNGMTIRRIEHGDCIVLLETEYNRFAIHIMRTETELDCFGKVTTEVALIDV